MSHLETYTNKYYGDISRSSEVLSFREQTWQYIHINSLQGEPGSTPGRFKVRLSTPVSLDTLRLIGFSCTQSIANLRDPFILDEQGFPPVTGQMPQGFYTLSNIATELSNYLNSISPGGLTYTVSFNPINYQLTISTTSNWRFNNISPLNSFYYGIGYNQSTDPVIQAYALSHASQGVLDLQPVRGNLNIQIEELSSYNTTGRLNFNYHFTIEGNSISSGYTFHSAGNVNAQMYKDASMFRYSTFTVNILLDNGEPAPFIGGHTTLTFEYQTRKA